MIHHKGHEEHKGVRPESFVTLVSFVVQGFK